MTTLNVEAVDLGDLASSLGAAFGAHVEGAVVGRTQLRDEVARVVGCSQLEAEQMVDTMIGRGFLRSERLADGRETWRIVAPT